MNINYGDSGLIISYLQTFLKEYYSTTLHVTGKYDEHTHNALVKYLNYYNVQPAGKIYDQLIQLFPDLNRYFNVIRNKDSFDFISKYVNEEVRLYTVEIKNQLIKYLTTVGWKIDKYINYNHADIKNYVITIVPLSRENKFPNRDIMCMVNQFNGRYFYNLAIRDGIGTDDVVHSSDSYKLSVIECEPDCPYTIAHGYIKPTRLVIGCSQFTQKQIVSKSKTIDNVIDVTLQPRQSVKYVTNNTAKHLIIQLAIDDELSPSETTVIKVPVRLGDVNLDNVVDRTDRELLAQYIQSGAKLTGAQLVAASILQRKNEQGKLYFNNDDLEVLDKYLAGEIPMLGIVYYDQIVQTASNNISRLLVLKGDFSEDQYNIPIADYSTNPWMVHDKFLNYLLDMAIHPYSDPDSIYYLQKLMKMLYENYQFTPGKYDNQLRDLVKSYQDKHGIQFSLGYLDVETEAMILTELYGVGVIYNV